jgi:hypothetical protein
MVLVGRKYILILGLVGRVHIPIKAVLQARCAVFILYAFELLLAPTQSTSGMNKVGFGFRNEPVGKCIRDIL